MYNKNILNNINNALKNDKIELIIVLTDYWSKPELHYFLINNLESNIIKYNDYEIILDNNKRIVLCIEELDFDPNDIDEKIVIV